MIRVLLASLLLLVGGLAHGAAALRQEQPQALNGGAAATTWTSTAFASAALVGSTIGVWISNDTGAGTAHPTSVVDSAGQAYTFRCQGIDATAGQMALLYTFNSNASNTALTITATWAAATFAQGLWAFEVTGSSGYTGCTPTGSPQVNPGTGANVIDTGPVVGTGSTGLMVGLAYATSSPASNTIAAGTSPVTFTLGVQGFSFSGSANPATSENGHYTSSLPFAAFTDATHGAAASYLVFSAAFNDSGAGPTSFPNFFFMFPF